jgi:UrcA family protein
MNRSTHAIVILALGLTFQTANAAANTADQPLPAVQVTFKDLNLTRTEGAAALYRRLQSAAERVCEAADGASLASKMAFRKCVRGAVAAAVAKVDHPLLTAYYGSQTGNRTAAIQVAHK